MTRSSRLKSSARQGLTVTELHFVECMLASKTFNAVEAAKMVGFKNPSAAAKNMMKKPKVKNLLDKMVQKRSRTFEAKSHEILEQLAQVALRDPIDFCNEDGLIITDDLRNIPAHARQTIDGLEVKQDLDREGLVVGQTVKLKLVPKLGAIELLMKHLGMLDVDGNANGKNVTQIDWDAMLQRRSVHPPLEQDTVESEIAQMQSGRLIEASATAVETPDKQSGDSLKPKPRVVKRLRPPTAEPSA